MLETYEIDKIEEHTGDGIKIMLEAPIDAKLILGDSVHIVIGGVCNIQKSKLSDGDFIPKLYTSRGMTLLEGFIIKHGAVIRKNPDADYVRRLADCVDGLYTRVLSLENSLEEIQDKISRKISF